MGEIRPLVWRKNGHNSHKHRLTLFNTLLRFGDEDETDEGRDEDQREHEKTPLSELWGRPHPISNSYDKRLVWNRLNVQRKANRHS